MHIIVAKILKPIESDNVTGYFDVAKLTWRRPWNIVES